MWWGWRAVIWSGLWIMWWSARCCWRGRFCGWAVESLFLVWSELVSNPLRVCALHTRSERLYVVYSLFMAAVDHWKTQKIRAVVAKLLVSAMGRENVSLEALYRVLSTVPVINHSTTYTTLMSAQLGNYSSYARTTVPRFSSKSCSILSSSYYTSQ